MEVAVVQWDSTYKKRLMAGFGQRASLPASELELKPLNYDLLLKPIWKQGKNQVADPWVNPSLLRDLLCGTVRSRKRIRKPHAFFYELIGAKSKSACHTLDGSCTNLTQAVACSDQKFKIISRKGQLPKELTQSKTKIQSRCSSVKNYEK